MGDQLCAKKILNNHWISGVPILKGLIKLLKRMKFCLVNTETTVKIIWSSGNLLQPKVSSCLKNSTKWVNEVECVSKVKAIL